MTGSRHFARENERRTREALKAAKSHGWLPVTPTSPPLYDRVLFLPREGATTSDTSTWSVQEVRVGRRNEDSWRDDVDACDEPLLWKLEDVTLWQPLPEIPKENG